MSPNVLVPSAYDIAFTAAVIAALAVMAVALAVWFKDHRNGWGGLVEVAVIIFVPLIGAVAYLVSRRRAHPVAG